jgi:hypothetical protein
MQDNNRGDSLIIGVLIVTALLMSGFALGIALLRTPLEGIQGERGLKGENGTAGATGVQGPAGPTGPTGPQGLRGFNGTSEVNRKPTINITTTGSYHVLSNVSCRYTFNVTVKTLDLDNDTVHTLVYYKRNTTDAWSQKNVFFETNKTFTMSVAYNLTTPANQRMYWGVQAWDGRDIVVSLKDYLIIYP